MSDKKQAFEAAVQAQCAYFTEKFSAGAIDDLVDGYYTDNPRMIAPDAPFTQGRDAIKAMFRKLREDGILGIALQSAELHLDTDLGYEIGRALLTIRQDGGPVTQAARYLVTWRKTAEGWRVETDMFAMGEI